jgi:hypothetical protein
VRLLIPGHRLDRTPRALICVLAVTGIVAAGFIMRAFPAFAGSGTRQPRAASAASLRIQAQPGVSARTISLVRSNLLYLRPRIDTDFGVRDYPILLVRLYASHRAFAHALHTLEGVWPEGDADTSGNIVRGVLPLGPPNAYLRHNLAHTYTEWVLDRLTHNRSDRQPNPAWLYDGIAEWEAARRTAPLPCHLSGPYPLQLSSLTTARQWWRTRAGIYGGLAYCEAADEASRLITRVGWPTTRMLLHQSRGWSQFSRVLEAASARPSPHAG